MQLFSLDKMLTKGIYSNEIFEIAGLPSCGKTKLCYQLMINAIREYKTKILYVDSGFSFNL